MNKVEILVTVLAVCLLGVVCIYYWGNDLFMTIFILLVGILLGGLITFLTAKHYYLEASKEFKNEVEKILDETEKIKKFNNYTLRGLESTLDIGFSRDNEGNPTGLIQYGSAHIKSRSEVIVKNT